MQKNIPASLVCRWWIIAALVVGVFSAIGLRAAPLPAAEQEVIEAVLPQVDETRFGFKHVIEEDTSVKMLHLSTSYQGFSDNLRKAATDKDAAFKEALEDFIKKNAYNTRIEFTSNAPQNVVLIPPATVENIFSQRNTAKNMTWPLFNSLYHDSDGLTTISRVGIDSTGTVAIMYLGQKRSNTVGSGFLRILRKQNGKWVFQVTELFGPRWVS